MRIIKERLNRTEPPKLLKDRFMLTPRSLLFPQHHFLFEIFDQKLQRYIEADLVGYSLRFWDNEGNLKRFETYKKTFAILTLGELEAGFVVCLVPLVLSILVFAIEWLPTLKDLVVFLIIFQKFFDLRKIEQSKHSDFMKIKFAQWQAVLQERTDNTNRDNICNAESFLNSVLQKVVQRKDNFMK